MCSTSQDILHTMYICIHIHTLTTGVITGTRGDDTVPLVHVITLVVCSIDNVSGVQYTSWHVSIYSSCCLYAIHRCAHHVCIPLFPAVPQFHPHTEEEPWNPPQGQLYTARLASSQGWFLQAAFHCCTLIG